MRPSTVLRFHEARKKRIRELNDRFRQQAYGNGSILITAGIQSLGESKMSEVIAAVQNFTAFTQDNDPHNEHDFGAIDIANAKVFWKIDYFDLSRTMHSPDPADETVSHRVLTVMLASEY